MKYSWHFNKKRPSDKERNPIQGEFFATDAIESPGEALVREGIQNSLDARQPGEKVSVRIALTGKNNETPPELTDLFMTGLTEHLHAPKNGLRNVPSHGEQFRALVFEDFGTSGLVGDPNETSPPSGSCNRFYHFFRAEGVSEKSEKDRGRWGVGKQVFPRASRINTIFGYTVRQDDKRSMLMGMAVLRTHDVNGSRFVPDGLYGQHKECDDIPVLPIEDEEQIDIFKKVFRLERDKTRPGLSVVVPWCDEEITEEDLLRAVLRGYFWPILKGQLEVTVESDIRKTIFRSENLEAELKQMDQTLQNEILPHVELAQWSQGLNETDYAVLASPSSELAWTWSKSLFPESQLESVRSKYERGEKLAIRVPVTVREKRRENRESFFDVLLYRDGTEQRSRPVFIREGIVIPDVSAPITRGIRSIVIAEDGPIGAFLGDAENPAHTQWQHAGDNFKGKYVSGRSDLQFVIRAVREIIDLITSADQKEDRKLLCDFFSIPAPVTSKSIQNGKKSDQSSSGLESAKPEIPELPQRQRPFVIEQFKTGFVIRNGTKGTSLTPDTIVIRAAYDARRGNPFNDYHPADFSFSKQLTTKVKGAAVLEKKDNHLRIAIKESEFYIEVTGFDPKRDLRVEAKVQESSDVS